MLRKGTDCVSSVTRSDMTNTKRNQHVLVVRGTLPDGLGHRGVLRNHRWTGQDDMANVVHLLPEEEAILAISLDARVSNQPQDVVAVVDVVLHILGDNDDGVEVNQTRLPSGIDKMTSK